MATMDSHTSIIVKITTKKAPISAHTRHGEQKPVHVIVFIAPDGGEHEEHLDEHAAERQNPAHHAQHVVPAVERTRGDRARDCRRAARIVRIAEHRSAQQRPQNVQRQPHDQQQAEQREDGFPRELRHRPHRHRQPHDSRVRRHAHAYMKRPRGSYRAGVPRKRA